jgi:hypothetical protein
MTVRIRRCKLSIKAIVPSLYAEPGAGGCLSNLAEFCQAAYLALEFWLVNCCRKGLSEDENCPACVKVRELTSAISGDPE